MTFINDPVTDTQTRIIGQFPAFIKKLLTTFKEKGVYGSLKHIRAIGLYRTHEQIARLLGRNLDKGMSAGKVEMDRLTIDSTSKTAAETYWPTPWNILGWVHGLLPRDKSDWTFLDLGAGKGRTLISAMQYNYKSVIGVEFSPDLAEIARQSIAAHTPVASHVELREQDASLLEVPEGPVMVFLFHPFGPPVIDRVAERLRDSYLAKPRPMLVAYLNPAHADSFLDTGIFHHRPLPVLKRLKFGLFSSHPFALYATREA